MLIMFKGLTIIVWVCHNWIVEFEKKIAKIYDISGTLKGKGDQTRGNLFYLDINDATCIVVEFNDVWLWNKRLYHVNFDNLVSINNMKKYNLYVLGIFL